VQYAVYAPCFGALAEPAAVAALAADAEAAGWDGFFVWDHLAMWWDRSEPVGDTWVTLSAVALATSRIRFGPLVTPLPRRRPHKVARETVALDHLSGGRLILGVGLGANPHEFEDLGEADGLRARAAMLDEGLEVLTGLWSGEPFEYEGIHYRVSARFLPRPLQRPRIPIWVAGSWPKRAPFRRAARYDGALAVLAEPGPFNTPPEAVRGIRDYVSRFRDPARPFDIFLMNGNPEWDPDRDAEEVARYAGTGLTWWGEGADPFRFGWQPGRAWPADAIRERVIAGPPGTRE
jgi:alkanesulfonate monooxygenase SsuD/methylene tetrahydromethanopterin reductase-like flavin-dependent oxidoreductase (luciferase family)